MSELARSLQSIDAIKSAHVQQAPNGRFYLVGHVPASCLYTMADGSALTTPAIATIRHCGPGLLLGAQVEQSRRIVRVTFDTADLAAQAVISAGGNIGA